MTRPTTRWTPNGYISNFFIFFCECVLISLWNPCTKFRAAGFSRCRAMLKLGGNTIISFLGAFFIRFLSFLFMNVLYLVYKFHVQNFLRLCWVVAELCYGNTVTLSLDMPAFCGSCSHTNNSTPIFFRGCSFPHHNNPPVYSIMANNYLFTVSFIHKKKIRLFVWFIYLVFLEYTTRRVTM